MIDRFFVEVKRAAAAYERGGDRDAGLLSADDDATRIAASASLRRAADICLQSADGVSLEDAAELLDAGVMLAAIWSLETRLGE